MRHRASITEFVVGAGQIADMGYAARHHDITAQLPLVTFGNKDTAIMRQAAGEGTLIYFNWGAIIVTMPVFGLERVEPGRKMDRAGGNLVSQLDERRRSGLGGINYPAAICSAATTKQKRAQTERSSETQTAHPFRHFVNSSRLLFASIINPKLRGEAAPVMFQLA